MRICAAISAVVMLLTSVQSNAQSQDQDPPKIEFQWLLDQAKISTETDVLAISVLGQQQSVWIKSKSVFEDLNGVIERAVSSLCTANNDRHVSIYQERTRKLNSEIIDIVKNSKTLEEFILATEVNENVQVKNGQDRIQLKIPYCKIDSDSNIKTVKDNDTLYGMMSALSLSQSAMSLASLKTKNEDLFSQTLPFRANSEGSCNELGELSKLECLGKYIRKGDTLDFSGITSDYQVLSIAEPFQKPLQMLYTSSDFNFDSTSSSSLDKKTAEGLFYSLGIEDSENILRSSPDKVAESAVVTLNNISAVSPNARSTLKDLELFGDPNHPIPRIKDSNLKALCDNAALQAEYPYDSNLLWKIYSNEVQLAGKNYSTAKVGIIDFGFHIDGFNKNSFLSMDQPIPPRLDGEYQTYGRSYSIRATNSSSYKYGGNIQPDRSSPSMHGTQVTLGVLGGPDFYEYTKSALLNQEVFPENKPPIKVRFFALNRTATDRIESEHIFRGLKYLVVDGYYEDQATGQSYDKPTVDIINLSAGVDNQDEVFKELFNTAGSFNKTLLIGAAGNHTDVLAFKERVLGSYGDKPNIISVASSGPKMSWMPFSGWDSKRVTISAPGCGIRSINKDWSETKVLGTSHSAPQVTFASALLRSLYGKRWSPVWAKTRLEITADSNPSFEGLVANQSVLNLPRAVSLRSDLVTVGNDSNYYGLIETDFLKNVELSCLPGQARALRFSFLRENQTVSSQPEWKIFLASYGKDNQPFKMVCRYSGEIPSIPIQLKGKKKVELIDIRNTQQFDIMLREIK